MKYKNLLLLILLSIVAMGTLEAQVQTGIASFYADKFEGRLTASGEKYKHNKATAAHKFLPFGTKVKVTNTANGKSVIVRVNDRGPYIEGRIIDLSRSAAEELAFTTQGLADVKVEVVDAGDGRQSSVVIPNPEDPVDITEYFSIEAEREEPTGFGVQIGSFEGYDNVLRLSENLQNSYRKDLIVQVKKINDKKVYALIVGEFNSREKAYELREEINTRYPDAFVVKY
jgi:rare lipoprotein A